MKRNLCMLKRTEKFLQGGFNIVAELSFIGLQRNERHIIYEVIALVTSNTKKTFRIPRFGFFQIINGWEDMKTLGINDANPQFLKDLNP